MKRHIYQIKKKMNINLNLINQKNNLIKKMKIEEIGDQKIL